MKKADIKEKLEKFGICLEDIPPAERTFIDGMELFPSARAKVISGALEAFDNKYAEEKIANQIQQNPTQALYAELDCMIPAPGEAGAEGALVAGAAGAAAAAAAPRLPVTLPVWRSDNETSEVKESGLSHVLIRLIQSKVSNYFMGQCARAFMDKEADTGDLQVRYVDVAKDLVSPKKGKQKVEKKEKGGPIKAELMFMPFQTETEVELPFWGNVLLESSAKFLSRDLLMDLKFPKF